MGKRAELQVPRSAGLAPNHRCGFDSWTIIYSAKRDAIIHRARLLWTEDTNALTISVVDNPHGGSNHVVTFCDLAQFVIRPSALEIVVIPLDDQLSVNTIDHLLVDQIWPRLVAHNGQLVIHASAAANKDGAIMAVGQSGRGKSTLAASLHQRGLSLLGDDAIVISQQSGMSHCRAVYQSLRLFPDSIASVFDAPVTQSEVAAYTAKRNIRLDGTAEDTFSHPIRAIFFLDADDGHSRAASEEIAPADACMRLIEHSFWLDPTDVLRTADKLKSASALASGVPCFQLSFPRDFDRIGELHDTIFEALQ